ncbi:unnamed protein product [Caenorhabditis sp. 36 PRJEB53466]|nr:unnamed protein product [Caenorhabditis sp. 36 PRJEB53466]
MSRIRGRRLGFVGRIIADENLLYLAMVIENILALSVNDFHALLQYLQDEVVILNARHRQFNALFPR